ncbi:MAG TPA: hypothetical protein VGH28_33185 [Polyangiaceae bacterium]|jgi:acetate kinase
MPLVLTVNIGSSSVKLATFDAGSLARTGNATATRVTNREEALDRALSELGAGDVVAVGHRVVHGGPRFDAPARLGPDVIAALRELAWLDPEHLPAELDAIESLERRLPNVPHVACFDTAFHRDLPRVARLLPIPLRYEREGVRRYGFHGLSYTFLVGALGDEARGRVVLAHLGSGASLAAVVNGKPIETTMAFSPASGIPMGTRSGDLDPGVMLHFVRQEGLSADAIARLVNHESGLRGLSETSGDVRDLLAAEATDPRAKDALAVFVYRVKLAIGSLAAAMGGIDLLVFSGGIGENAPLIRERITAGLEHLRFRTRVIPTDEEIVIARQTLEALR